MIEAIIAGIGLGKLSEDIVADRNQADSISYQEDDQVGWCPEMDNEE